MASYKGTKVTGTSTTGKAFPKVKSETKKWFYVGDTYTNTKTGNVYNCTSAGYAKGTTKYPNPAKWSYDHTNIIGRPNAELESLTAPKRDKGAGEYVYSTSWKVPEALTSTKSGRRADRLGIVMFVEVKAGSTKDSIGILVSGPTSTASAEIDLNDISEGSGYDVFRMRSINPPYTRQSFWPYTDWKVKELILSVRGENAKGLGGGGDTTLKMKAPEKPTVVEPELITSGTDAGKVKCVITPAPDTGDAERLRTVWDMWLKDVGSAGNGKWVKSQQHSDSDEDITAWCQDLANWQDETHHYVVAFRAKSQGLGGDSAWTPWRFCGVGWPKKPTVGNVIVGDASDGQSYGRLEVNGTFSDKEYPVDGVVLQALVSSDASTAQEAAASNDWDDTPAEDNGACKALAFLISSLPTQAGKHTWLRVKSWNDVEDLFATYSDPVEVTALYNEAPTAADNACTIHGTPVPHGSGAVDVTVLWDSTGSSDDDDAKYLNISYSPDKDAWESVPKSYEVEPFDWSKASTVPGWRKMAVVKVNKLEDDTVYWFRAQVVIEDADGNDEAGPWCSAVAGTPTQAPTGVTVNAPSLVATGDGIPVSWSLVGGGMQTRWAVYDVGGNVLNSGTGPSGSCVVPSASYADKLSGGRLALRVGVSTGGGDAMSDITYVAVADAPELSIGVLSLESQPLSVPLACTVRNCEIALTVTSMGSAKAFPYPAQPAGDTVWTSVPLLTWVYSQSDHLSHATAVLPTCDFRNGAGYAVEAVATDPATGLSSERAYASVAASFEDATASDEAAEVEAFAEVDSGGDMRRYAVVSLVGELAEGECYDVYRLTLDGCVRIAESLHEGDSVRDDYAPFGPGAYRVVIRTADGVSSWFDYDYDLDGVGLRFDFQGESHAYVELPWDVTQQESYAKDFKKSKAMDGTQEGSWNAGVDHKGRYSTDVIKLQEREQVEAVLDLARYAGPVFVRTSSGLAFCANVNVDDFGWNYNTAVVPFSFTADEIDGKGLFAGERVDAS